MMSQEDRSFSVFKSQSSLIFSAVIYLPSALSQVWFNSCCFMCVEILVLSVGIKMAKDKGSNNTDFGNNHDDFISETEKSRTL